RNGSKGMVSRGGEAQFQVCDRLLVASTRCRQPSRDHRVLQRKDEIGAVMNAPDIRKFLADALVWPGSDSAPCWINLHNNMVNKTPSDTSAKNNGGKPWVVGYPYKTVESFISRYNWAETQPYFFNAWMCMSQQSESTKTQAGKPKAIRKAANATKTK